MRRVYLVRHASPAVAPDRPARQWPLSAQGIDEARRLAGASGGWGIAAVYSSSEPKARATALAIADRSGLPVHIVDAFDELVIDGWIGNAADFNEVVRRVLLGDVERLTDRGTAEHRPQRTEEAPPSIPRAENAAAAAARFERGLELIAGGPFPALVVSHGRILTAYLSRAFDAGDAYAYWRRIPMPGWAMIDLDAPGGEAPEFRGLQPPRDQGEV